VELMITITIVGIIAVMALPSFRDLIASQRVRNVAQDLMSAIIFARSEAIKRNAQINIVPAGGDWNAGWSVQTSGAVTLRVQDAPTGLTITGPVGNLVYQGNGRVTGATAILYTFRSSVATTVTMRCLVIDPSGRPNVQLDKDTDTTNGCT
jgi:type IV fimbrial biogenesis protein FimT